MLPGIITDTSIMLMFPSGPKTVHSSHLHYKTIRQGLNTLSVTELEELFDVKAAIVRWTQGLYRITDEGVYKGTERLPSCLERRILGFLEEGLPFEPLLKFHARLEANPSGRAVQELYTFLENKNLPITSEGMILGYKAVRRDWYDIYSGTILNTVGSTISMPRNKVDDNCNQTCSYGLHIGSIEYVKMFGGSADRSRILIVEFDPADVVSVPIDYHGQKLRACKYKVLQEMTNLLPDTLYQPVDESRWLEDNDTCEDEFLDEQDPDVCPECGADGVADCNFCPICGTELE